MPKVTLTVSEQIDRARDGRTQSWIVKKMNESGLQITEVSFSRKKKGFDEFTKDELLVLSAILNTEITQ